MQIEAEKNGPFQVIKVGEARIDAPFAIRFKERVRELTAGGTGPVALDLSKVDFVDSSGLGAIVAVMKLLGVERRLHLVGLSPNVNKVFRLTRMDSVFSIHNDISSAVASAAG